jgi:hypothetical protein
MTVRILITGSRTWTNISRISSVLAYHRQAFPGATLVHGDARGADWIAATVWDSWGLPTEAHPVTAADWQERPGRAGHDRNARMVSLGASLCLAFIRNSSPGATACAQLAERAGIPTYRHLETERP